MDKDDARKLSPAEQHERRRQVIGAYKRGRTRAQIAAEVGLSHPTVTRVIERYEAEGVSTLAPRTRGRRHGEDRALTEQQEAAIRQLISDKRPEQLKFSRVGASSIPGAIHSCREHRQAGFNPDPVGRALGTGPRPAY